MSDIELAFIAGNFFCMFLAMIGTIIEYFIKKVIAKHKEKKEIKNNGSNDN